MTLHSKPHLAFLTTKFENAKTLFFNFNIFIKQDHSPLFKKLLLLKIGQTQPILGYDRKSVLHEVPVRQLISKKLIIF